MKKICFVLLTLFDCNNSYFYEEQENRLISRITKKIIEIREPVLKKLEKFREYSSKENASYLTDVQFFLNNPEISLKRLSSEEKGIEKLELMDVLLSNETDKIPDKLEKVDPDLRSEYEKAYQNNKYNSNFLIYNKSHINNTDVWVSRGLAATCTAGVITFLFSPWPWLKVGGLVV